MKKNFRLISFLTPLLVFVQINTPYIALAQQFFFTPSSSLILLPVNFSTGTRDIRPFLDIHQARIPPPNIVSLRETVVGGINSIMNLRSLRSVSSDLIDGNITKIEKQASVPAGTWQSTEFTYDALNNLKTLKDPLLRVTTYNYDNNENVVCLPESGRI
jgi:YD repeat-containing protein